VTYKHLQEHRPTAWQYLLPEHALAIALQPLHCEPGQDIDLVTVPMSRFGSQMKTHPLAIALQPLHCEPGLDIDLVTVPMSRFGSQMNTRKALRAS